MGRWAQRRLRGGGAENSAPPPPVLVRLTSVQALNDFDAQLAFDGDITVDGGASLDNFTINGQGMVTVAQAGPSTATVTISGAITPGDGWVLSAQPSWVAEALHVPDSGVVSGP